MLRQNLLANVLGGAQHGAMGDGAAERRGQRNHRRDVVRPLVGDRAGNDAAQAVPDQVDLALGFHKRLFDVLIQAALDQDVRAVCIEADAGKVRAIADALQPGTQLCQISVGAQESGNDDHTGAIAMWYAEAVVDR